MRVAVVVPVAGDNARSPLAVSRMGERNRSLNVIRDAVVLFVAGDNARSPLAVSTIGVLTLVVAVNCDAVVMPDAGDNARSPLAVSRIGERSRVVAVNCTSVSTPLALLASKLAAAPGELLDVMAWLCVVPDSALVVLTVSVDGVPSVSVYAAPAPASVPLKPLLVASVNTRSADKSASAASVRNDA